MVVQTRTQVGLAGGLVSRYQSKSHDKHQVNNRYTGEAVQKQVLESRYESWAHQAKREWSEAAWSLAW